MVIFDRKLRTLASAVSVAFLLLNSGPTQAASDPAVDCQKATAKAVRTCVNKASKQQLTCFKKTGAACLGGDSKIAGALAKVEQTILDDCVDDAAVDAAGYAPLTPATLVAHFQASCTREADAIAARAFGEDGALLEGASDDDVKCLQTVGKETNKLLGTALKTAGKCAGKECDLDKVAAAISKASTKADEKIAKKCSGGSRGTPASLDVADTLAQLVSATAAPCDPLDTTHCLFPMSNDYFSAVDPTSASGRRLAFSVEAMPKNNASLPVDPTRWNIIDGFSVGPVLLTDNQSIDLVTTGAPPITDLAASLDPGSPVVLIDAETGEQQLLYMERDQSASVPAQRALIARVAKNLKNDHRYVFAIRNAVDSGDTPVDSSPIFAAYRDAVPTTQFPVEARRPHMEEIFTILSDAGIARENLYLAWDFTTQSVESTTRKLLAMRDDTVAIHGANAPAFTVDSVEEPFNSEIFRRINGTFQVPLYLTDGGIPGSSLRLDEDGLPVNEGDFFTAKYRCLIPYAATTAGGAPAIPGRAALYGHGLLGTESQVSASHVQDTSSEHNFIICGTQWTGFADEDFDHVIQVLLNFSRFPTFIERQHQGVLNFMTLGKLLLHADGFADHAAFQVGGESVIDPSALFYDGNSQGGILGGVLAAFSQDIERFVLGVPGINYSTLLRRSVDFDPFNVFLEVTYANGLDRQVLLGIAQLMWDQTDPSGHVNHVTADTYPNTPPKKLLYHVAFGDHQVSDRTANIAARNVGASLYTPALDPLSKLSDVTPYFGIPAIPSYPFDGSAIVIWDSGNPEAPLGNVAPAEITDTDPEWADLGACAQDHGSDPHECPRRSAAARLQKSEFLKIGGAVVDVCGGMACVANTP